MIDRPLFIAVTSLIVIGIIFSYSLTAYTVLYYNVKPYHFFLRQFIAGMVGIIIMWFLARQEPKKIIKPVGFSVLFFSSVLMLALPFMPEQFATEAGGAKRWVRLGVVSLAPVEFFKVGFVFFLAWSLSRKVLPLHMQREKDHKYTLKEEFLILLPYIVIFIFAMLIIAIFQNDLGQVVVLAFTLLVMMLFAGSSLRFFIFSILVALVAFALFIATSPHRIERVKGWWFMLQNLLVEIFPRWASKVPRVDLSQEPYQISNSLHAIHNGGLFGEGLGNGILKLGFLSEVHTDFILAGIAEEIGLVGVALIVLLVMFIIFRLLKIAGRSDEPVYYLYCVGLAMVIGVAFLINALGISGVIPLKGIAVPFLSYGGSQILALSIGMGLALSMSKKAKL